MAMANAFSADDARKLDAAERALIERRARVLGPAYRLFYERPVHLVRGEGVWLFDEQGRRYLDAYNNVASMGHSHPRVVEAIASQLAVLNTHTRYIHDRILDYAEALVATMPRELSQVMVTCTGSEANDLAVRIARHLTGGTGIIATAHAYHGLSCAVSEFSPSLGSGVPLGPHVRTVPAPDADRGPGADVGARFAQGVQAAIDDLVRHGIKPAMLIVDTIFSSDGVVADPAGFLQPAVAAIRKAGGLFVADEVQPGFGRTGDAMWGFQRHGLVPDMVSMGKPMGNGYPIAGLVCRPEVIEDFGRKARYFNTFGGNAVAASAGLAVLGIIRDEGLVANAREVGLVLRDGIRALAARHPAIGDVRGAGLFIGADLVRDSTPREPAPELATRLVNGLRERGVLISSSGPHANVLKIRPPLVFSRDNAQTLLAALEEALATI